VLDAYCPHLGADDCIVCPVSTAGASTGAGSNVEIPYREDRQTAQRGCHAWPAVEPRPAPIFVWHSEASTEPDWELPKIPESEDRRVPPSTRPSRRAGRFRSHPQEVFENTVDIAHFRHRARVSGFGDLDLETDGHRLRAIAEVTFQTPRGPVSGAVDSELYGMGLDVVRHRGLGRSCTLLTVTPRSTASSSMAALHVFRPDRPRQR